MSYLANCTISILSPDTAYDDRGDEVDSDEVLVSGVPASILERPVTGVRPASGRADTPRTHALRVWRSAAVRALTQNCRIRVDTAPPNAPLQPGQMFVVITLAPSTNNVGLASTRADLQRVT